MAFGLFSSKSRSRSSQDNDTTISDDSQSAADGATVFRGQGAQSAAAGSIAAQGDVTILDAGAVNALESVAGQALTAGTQAVDEVGDIANQALITQQATSTAAIAATGVIAGQSQELAAGSIARAFDAVRRAEADAADRFVIAEENSRRDFLDATGETVAAALDSLTETSQAVAAASEGVVVAGLDTVGDIAGNSLALSQDALAHLRAGQEDAFDFAAVVQDRAADAVEGTALESIAFAEDAISRQSEFNLEALAAVIDGQADALGRVTALAGDVVQSARDADLLNAQQLETANTFASDIGTEALGLGRSEGFEVSQRVITVGGLVAAAAILSRAFL